MLCDDKAEFGLVRFTLINMLNFDLNSPSGQLRSFLLSSHPRQAVPGRALLINDDWSTSSGNH